MLPPLPTHLFHSDVPILFCYFVVKNYHSALHKSYWEEEKVEECR